MDGYLDLLFYFLQFIGIFAVILLLIYVVYIVVKVFMLKEPIVFNPIKECFTTSSSESVISKTLLSMQESGKKIERSHGQPWSFVKPRLRPPEVVDEESEVQQEDYVKSESIVEEKIPPEKKTFKMAIVEMMNESKEKQKRIDAYGYLTVMAEDVQKALVDLEKSRELNRKKLEEEKENFVDENPFIFQRTYRGSLLP